MSYYIDVEVENRLGLDIEELLKLVAEKTLETENCPYEAEINFTLTNDASIQELNKQFRMLDASTDVLSFPALEYACPSDFDSIHEEDNMSFNPETGELLLGDIVVSQDHVLAQSSEYGHSVRRELAFLIAHSVLHLCGYDHMTPEQAAVMEEKQRRVLDELGITRED